MSRDCVSAKCSVSIIYIRRKQAGTTMCLIRNKAVKRRLVRWNINVWNRA